MARTMAQSRLLQPGNEQYRQFPVPGDFCDPAGVACAGTRPGREYDRLHRRSDTIEFPVQPAGPIADVE